jgi:glycine/D-amino acid oxidase-like deaminating enzyme
VERCGFSVIVIEKEALGAGQTLASQGMIHGGQKYTLQGTFTGPAASIASMPHRWDEAFAGRGDIDLRAAQALSETQVMWPTGSLLSEATVFAAAQLVNSGTKKLAPESFPEALRKIPGFKGPVYELPEKVLDAKSLVQALSQPLEGRLFKGEVTELGRDGRLVVSGQTMKAQAVICAAGTGNVHQIMVKTLPDAVYGHIVAAGRARPRATITSHPLAGGGYVWYIGGGVAEHSVTLDAKAAIAFAAREMKEMFPHIDWRDRQWATCPVDRGESYEPSGNLPPGPHIQPCGKVLITWPAKLTFAPALSDRVEAWLKECTIAPLPGLSLPALPPADIGAYPWETASWSNAA